MGVRQMKNWKEFWNKNGRIDKIIIETLSMPMLSGITEELNHFLPL